MTILLVSLYLLLLPILGLGTLGWLASRLPVLRAEFWLPIAFVLGLLTQQLALLASLLFLGKIIWPVLLLSGLAIAVGGFLFGRRDLLRILGPADFLPPRAPLEWILAAFLLLGAGILVADGLSYPAWNYDSRAIWTYKGRILYNERTTITDSFSDPERIHYHREYPLLVPGIHFVLYTITNDYNERAVRQFFSHFLLFTVLLSLGALRHLGVSRALSLGMATALLYMHFRWGWPERMMGNLTSGSADAAFTLFALLAVVAIIAYWKDRSLGFLLLAGCAIGTCLLAKKEGIVLLAALSAGAGFEALLRCRKDGYRTLLLPAIPVALAIALYAPQAYLNRYQPMFYEEDYGAQMRWDFLSRVHERIPALWGSFRYDFPVLYRWNYLWYVVLIVAVERLIALLRLRKDFTLDVAIAAWLTAIFCIYLISPLDLRFHLLTSADRLLFQVIPLIFLRIGLWLAEITGEQESQGLPQASEPTPPLENRRDVP